MHIKEKNDAPCYNLAMAKDDQLYKKLSDLLKGDTAQIVRLDGRGEVRNRLLEMGLVKGTHVSLIRVAPLGDPLVVLVHGFQLSLRKEEAAFVVVQVFERNTRIGPGLRSRMRKGRGHGKGKKA